MRGEQMIQKVGFLHYLSEVTYRAVCDKFGLDPNDQRGLENYVTYADSKITKIHLFNLEYKEFGHKWFMHVDVDFPRFDCTYEAFPSKLYEAYRGFFGHAIADTFPP